MAALTAAAVYVAGRAGEPPVTLVSVSLYGLLALLSAIALQREQHFRGIFYQMCFLFTSFNLLIAIRAFSTFLPGNTQSDIYVYSTMLLPLFMCWTAVYVLYAYAFHDWSESRRIFLTLLTVLPLWLIAFWPYYFAPRALPSIPEGAPGLLYYRPLIDRATFVNLMSLSAILVFFLIKLRSDKTIGVYIDTLMFWFCVFVIFEILFDFGNVTNYAVLKKSQFPAAATLAMLAVTFVLRVRFLSQAAGKLYESQLVSPEPFIGRRSGIFDRFIRGNFFNSKANKKRLFLETPRGRITLRFLKGRPAGTAAYFEEKTTEADEGEPSQVKKKTIHDRGE